MSIRPATAIWVRTNDEGTITAAASVVDGDAVLTEQYALDFVRRDDLGPSYRLSAVGSVRLGSNISEYDVTFVAPPPASTSTREP